jgi:predicted alpha/beta-fold hydrolase
VIGWFSSRGAIPPGHFRPLPLLSNPHLQTVLGQYLPAPSFPHPSREHLVELPDGDCVVLHDTAPAGWRPGGPVALLLHGVTGSHRSPLVVRLARLLLPRGVRVVRMDLRGAGRGAALARRAYHAGLTADVRAAALEVHRWSPGSPLALVGFSLGGNLALKLAGEAAEDSVPGLRRVAAVGPPLDLVRCAELLARPANRLYERWYLGHLVAQARARERLVPGAARLPLPAPRTVRGFDEAYTAPQWGFAGADDYYRRASALPYVGRIGVPTFILTARDDPFVAVGPFEELAPPPHVAVRIAEHGGHLGFLGPDGAGGIRWAERQVAEWVAAPADGPQT